MGSVITDDTIEPLAYAVCNTDGADGLSWAEVEACEVSKNKSKDLELYYLVLVKIKFLELKNLVEIYSLLTFQNNLTKFSSDRLVTKNQIPNVSQSVSFSFQFVKSSSLFELKQQPKNRAVIFCLAFGF